MNGSTKILVPLSNDLPEEMVRQYLQSCRKDLATLQRALSEFDWERARLFGHQLKGTGQPYGFLPLTQLGAAVERAAVRRDATELGALSEQLDDYLSRVEITGE